jgi:hypothetical protein
MKIIDAVWEKRNLNLNTTEIDVEAEDTFDRLLEAITNDTSDYLVVRLPAGSSKLLCNMERLGLTYVEDMVRLVHNLNSVVLTPVELRMFAQTGIRKMDGSELDELCRQVERGIFGTDRISVDSFFDENVANKRYAYWIRDEFERGTSFYIYLYKNQDVGFFSLKEQENGVYVSTLGGLYVDKRIGGLGSIISYHVIDEVKRLGGTKVKISVSTNNIVDLKAVICNGYVPEYIEHIYIKHREN